MDGTNRFRDGGMENISEEKRGAEEEKEGGKNQSIC